MKTRIAAVIGILVAVMVIAQTVPSISHISDLSVPVTPELRYSIMTMSDIQGGRITIQGSNLVTVCQLRSVIPIHSITGLVALPSGVYPSNFLGGTFSMSGNKCILSAQFKE
jgi:hypothetical protein